MSKNNIDAWLQNEQTEIALRMPHAKRPLFLCRQNAQSKKAMIKEDEPFDTRHGQRPGTARAGGFSPANRVLLLAIVRGRALDAKLDRSSKATARNDAIFVHFKQSKAHVELVVRHTLDFG
jgi:hypothetical protein